VGTNLQLEVRSPEGGIYSGPVKSLVVRALDGELGILPGHAPLATILSAGQIRLQKDNGEDLSLDISDGFLVVRGDLVTVLLKNAS
jgi:F-type H+-transporting ATPase subunit epsilon